MNPAQQLYDLQTLDLRLAADAAKLEAERAKIQEPRSLREARARLRSAEQQALEAKTALDAAELEVKSVEAKKKAVHDKLYSGRVTVPRELAALESEEEGLARSQDQLEERELETMAALEAADAALQQARQAVDEESARWRQEGGEAHAHIPAMEAALDELKQERQALADTIVPNLVSMYERLKPRKGNRPVALVDKNACQGCGVALPSSEVQRARGADPPQLCDNCGRILYVR